VGLTEPNGGATGTAICFPGDMCLDFHYHPESYFERRPVFYYTAAPMRGPCREPVLKVECAPLRVPACELPFQPPWKVLPWQNPPPIIQKFKVVGHRPDETQKGSMIDVLI